MQDASQQLGGAAAIILRFVFQLPVASKVVFEVNQFKLKQECIFLTGLAS